MLATRIKQLRETRGLDISQLEQLTTISAAHLYRIEKGQRIPGADTLARLASALETSADYLLGISDDPSPRPITNHPALLNPLLQELINLWPDIPPLVQESLLNFIRIFLQERRKKRGG